MKNFTLLFITIFSAFYTQSLKSQGNYNYNWAFDVYLLEQNPVEIKTNGEFSEVKLVESRKKNTYTYIKRFNEKGLLTECYKGKDSDSTEKKAVITYNDQLLHQQVNFYRKHKLNHQYLYTFNDKNEITQLLKNNNNGNVLSNRTWKYDSTGNVEEATISAYKSMEAKIVWKYEYYDEGKMAKASRFKKGKLKEEWDYMCNTAGEKVTQKNLHKVCQWHEYSKDTLTAIYQSTNHKGKTVKTIYKYTLDTLILAEFHYNAKNELKLKMTYDSGREKLISYTRYKKNNPKFELTQVFLDGKLISSKGTKPNKDKTLYRHEYVYDESKNLTEIRYCGKKDEVISNIKVTYTKR